MYQLLIISHLFIKILNPLLILVKIDIPRGKQFYPIENCKLFELMIKIVDPSMYDKYELGCQQLFVWTSIITYRI